MGHCWAGEVVSTLWFDKTLRLWKQIYLFIFKYPLDFGSSGHGLLGHMPVTADHKILWCFPLMCITSPNFVESLSGFSSRVHDDFFSIWFHKSLLLPFCDGMFFIFLEKGHTENGLFRMDLQFWQEK